MATDTQHTEFTSDQAAWSNWQGHAAQRARQRAGLTPAQLLALWAVGRDASDQDARRFATIRVDGCEYRVAVYRWALYLIIRDALDAQPITLIRCPSTGAGRNRLTPPASGQ